MKIEAGQKLGHLTTIEPVGPGRLYFLADMGEKPSKEHSLDRIDVNGNYEPLNCRWASRVEQKANQRCSADRIRQLLDTFRRRDQKLIAELEIAIFGEGRVM